MKSCIGFLTLAAALAAPPPPLTMEAVRREGDPLKRFEQALRLAEARLGAAWKVVREAGARPDLEAAVDDVVAASELALESLRATGRPPGRLSRQYKRGELRTRGFEKGLKELSLAVGFEERERIEKARERVAAVHEQFLHAVMTGR